MTVVPRRTPLPPFAFVVFSIPVDFIRDGGSTSRPGGDSDGAFADNSSVVFPFRWEPVCLPASPLAQDEFRSTNECTIHPNESVLFFRRFRPDSTRLSLAPVSNNRLFLLHRPSIKLAFPILVASLSFGIARLEVANAL